MGFSGFFKRLFGGSKPAAHRTVVTATGKTVLAPERREGGRGGAREGTRVLVIDDSTTVLAVLRRYLEQNQYIVLEAETAEAGIQIARQEHPDLVFLDIVLPGMNGFTALRTLRREPGTKDIPVIMMSGNEQATEQFYAQRIGADDFMKKPFSRPELFARIERLLDADKVPKRFAAGATSQSFGGAQ
ncbi:MAG: response regulator [Xanthomonadales bacterium]|nr:response regulator [Xanthomonadales bacterium]MBK7146060.1 response regulator [Xanthomonadales bacterium]MCC6561679.1 response regulator [Xanthomonadales bacterium]